MFKTIFDLVTKDPLRREMEKHQIDLRLYLGTIESGLNFAEPRDELENAAFYFLYYENLLELPAEPDKQTPITIAAHAIQAREFIEKSKDYEAFSEAVIDLLKPFAFDTSWLDLLGDGRVLFTAKVPLTVEEVKDLAPRTRHHKFFKYTLEILTKNQENAKTAYDYVRDTAFEALLKRTKSIELTNRMQHTHIMGTTGAGKTQLIQQMIAHDLQEENATVVVIDNQGQMIPKLASLGLDMQYISPNYDLALNLFDFPKSRKTASLLSYVLAGLMDAGLTAKQDVVFQFAIELMVANRGNIYDLKDLMEGEVPDLSNVDPTTRQFFETQFNTSKYKDTKNEIAWRIWTLLKNSDLRDAFAAPFNRCHLELDRKLILIDCDIDVLQDYSGLFGRYFIAQLLQLAQSRFKGEHNPVYIYIDECYYFLDEKINEILATCRKANMGITVAHQFMEQFDDRKTATAVMSLISTKFASLLYANDAAMMAKAMRTTPEFINGQPLYHFALSQLRQPIVSVEVTGHIIENMPQHPIPHDEMRKRYGRKEEAKSAPSEPPAPQPESKSKPKARSKTSDNDVVERSKLSDWLSQNGDEQP
ncbi:MAG: type IV secretion system DNA-binding domain-containing protein [Pseudomonadota bacterium]